jgi:hypothetical protein
MAPAESPSRCGLSPADFQIILGKVRPFASPRSEPSTGSDHCSGVAVVTLNPTEASEASTELQQSLRNDAPGHASATATNAVWPVTDDPRGLLVMPGADDGQAQGASVRIPSPLGALACCWRCRRCSAPAYQPPWSSWHKSQMAGRGLESHRSCEGRLIKIRFLKSRQPSPRRFSTH